MRDSDCEHMLFEKISHLPIRPFFPGPFTLGKIPFCGISFTFVPKPEIGDLENPHENSRKVRVNMNHLSRIQSRHAKIPVGQDLI